MAPWWPRTLACVEPRPGWDADLPPHDVPISDEDLAALAMAADPTTPVAPDAVPLEVYLGTGPGLLPEWYMPRVTSRRATGRRRVVIGSLVGAFVLIEAFGLCSTYGQLPFH